MPSKKKYGQGAWRTSLLMDLEVPSGELCQVRRVGPVELVRRGIFQQLDFLGAIVATEHIAPIEEVTLPPSQRTVDVQAAMKAIRDDPVKMLQSLDVIDKVMETVIAQPKVFRPIRRDDAGNPLLDAAGAEIPLEDEERLEGVVYTDFIDLMDKMYIFQFVVGGTRDLETFRAEYGATLAGLEPGTVI